MRSPRTSLLAALLATGVLALSACTEAGGGGGGSSDEAAGGDGPACAEPAGGGRLSIATGNTTGVYYILGGGIANLLTEQVEGTEATAEATNASAENIRLVCAGDSDAYARLVGRHAPMATRTAAVLGANTVQLQLAVDPDANRLVVVAAVDNLTKGTAGGALQCANLALGLLETTGLPLVGVAP